MHGLSLFIVAAAVAQATPPTPPAVPHASWARMELELARAQAALLAAVPHLAMQLARVEAAAPALAYQLSQVAPQLTMQLAQVEAAAPALAQALAGVRWDVDAEPLGQAPEPWAQQDAGDSLYRAARDALNGNQHAVAAERFRLLRQRFPRSSYTPDAFYWEAFALYLKGSTEDLQRAQQLIEEQAKQYPRARTHRDAEVLLRRVQGVLARHGDADAAEQIAQDVERVQVSAQEARERPQDVREREAERAREAREQAREAREREREARQPARARSSECNNEDDIRAAALNAMLQMDADRAVPILKEVLAKRDAGSTCLRRKAIFLVSQKRSAETASILLQAARSDTDPEVRQQAVFWLSQVPSEEAVTALDSILRSSTDAELQDKAIFALSQHRSERAGAALRAYAERRDVSEEIREKAISGLSQHRSEANGEFLRGLFPRLESEALKEKVLSSLSRMRGEENSRWLLGIVGDRGQPLEIRKKALFWAGQGGVPIADLVTLYDRMDNREMREQLVFVYSQRREPAAVDKMLEIARSDPDRELRKKALFWLGQSRDPRVPELLLQIINQPEP